MPADPNNRQNSGTGPAGISLASCSTRNILLPQLADPTRSVRARAGYHGQSFTLLRRQRGTRPYC
jgi:hypothetical protein